MEEVDGRKEHEKARGLDRTATNKLIEAFKEKESSKEVRSEDHFD